MAPGRARTTAKKAKMMGINSNSILGHSSSRMATEI
jgi:hypothetical protein